MASSITDAKRSSNALTPGYVLKGGSRVIAYSRASGKASKYSSRQPLQGPQYCTVYWSNLLDHSLSIAENGHQWASGQVRLDAPH